MFKIIKIYLFPILASWLYWAINITIRVNVIGEEEIERLNKQNEKMIYVTWHGRQFLLLFYMRHRNIAILSSLSEDGEYQSRFLSKFGYKVVRGSSSRGGARALVGLINQMRQGADAAFAVDGPRGPVYEVKEGAVYLAKKMKAYIVPTSCSVKQGWIFNKAWDKYLLPHPFTNGVIIYGKPYLPSEDITEECKRLKEKLDALTEKADKMVKGD